MELQHLDKLMWEILKFLWTCPNKGREHPYRMQHIRTVMENTIEALATGQYFIIRNDDGSIRHYMAYWKVSKSDVETLINNGIKPDERCNGDTIYIVDHGNKGGRKSLTEMIGKIRAAARGCSGVFWHNWNSKEYRTFMRQKGT
jgi:hemolysin-activating ACP:hemolysin acyltransferase